MHVLSKSVNVLELLLHSAGTVSCGFETYGVVHGLEFCCSAPSDEGFVENAWKVVSSSLFVGGSDQIKREKQNKMNIMIRMFFYDFKYICCRPLDLFWFSGDIFVSLHRWLGDIWTSPKSRSPTWEEIGRLRKAKRVRARLTPRWRLGEGMECCLKCILFWFLKHECVVTPQNKMFCGRELLGKMPFSSRRLEIFAI